MGRVASQAENGTLQVGMRLSPSRFLQKSFFSQAEYGGNHDSIWNLESLCREQLHHIGGSTVYRHGRLDLLSNSITSSNRSQKTWKVSWRFSRSDMVVVCDNFPGCS